MDISPRKVKYSKRPLCRKPNTPVNRPARESDAIAAIIPPPPDTAFAGRLRAHMLRRRIFTVIGTAILAIFLLAGGAAALAIFATRPAAPAPTPTRAKTPAPTPTPPTPTPTPVTTAAPLTGLPVTPEEAKATVFSVIIENHYDARPQSGLQSAGVVYEANAEGGITRFQAFFQNDRPATLGPVRSLRAYFVDWGLEFDAPVAHAGGNATALDSIEPLGLKSLNGLRIGSPSFYRDNSRYAPHNFYTSSDALLQLISTKGWTKVPSFTPSPRKADAPAAAPTAANIHINYSYNGYQVDYAYSAATNDYARSLAGAPHIDKNTGQQIRVKNIVVEMMPTSYGTTRIGEKSVIMQTVGQGRAFVFRDGTAVEGTWVKDSRAARTRLLDASGAEIALDAGNTWYSIVPEGKSVSY